MQSLVLRLVTCELVLSSHDLVAGIFDFRSIFLELCFQFRDLENCHNLAGLHVSSVVDKEFLYVSGFLCVDINLLKRN